MDLVVVGTLLFLVGAAVALVGLISVIFPLKFLGIKTRKAGAGVLASGFGVLVVSFIVVGQGAGNSSNQTSAPQTPSAATVQTGSPDAEDAAAKKAKEEAARKAEEEARQREAKEKAAEYLAQAKDLIKEEKYLEAEVKLFEATANDADLAEAKTLLAEIEPKIAEAKAARDREMAEQAFERGVALFEEKEYRKARSEFGTAYQYGYRQDEVNEYLRQISWKELRYYEGGSTMMAISDVETSGRRVVMYVSIWNRSSERQHANPNNFTLIDSNGYSYGYDSSTFEYRTPFPAVDLQPDTKAGGTLVFMMNGDSKPERLIYQAFLGDQVERRFPSE